MNFAIVGCGYVLDSYLRTLKNYPSLKLVGLWDRDEQRMRELKRYTSAHAFSNFEELLNDRAVEAVVNLTNPRSHFEVSRACLNAGKHVYSEKPLAMCRADAQKLLDLARERKVYLAAAFYKCGLAVYVIQNIKVPMDPVTGSTRPAYATAHADSMLFAICFVIVIGLLIEQVNSRVKWLAAVALPILLAGTIANNRRLAWVQIGVVFFIYESRPNVTADAAALCIKSGNSVILRGGKEAFHSNRALHDVLTESMEECGLPRSALQLVETTDRAAVGQRRRRSRIIL